MHTMKRILLCPPDFYDIEYEINPWMHLENKVDRAAAAREYTALKATFQALPVELYEINAKPGLPDMIYAANCGQVVGETFIAANFKFPERRGESNLFIEYFENKFDFKTYRLPEGIYFEGQGDLLNTKSHYFLGWGKRTSFSALSLITAQLDKPAIELELIDPFFYHLDMSFTPLSDELAVIKEESFKPAGLKIIKDYFKDIIVPRPEDHAIMACNMVRVDNHIVIGAGISHYLKDEFKKRGFTVHEVPMAEYRKGGGSVKCSTFEF